MPNPARHQNEFTIPHRFKLGPRHQARPRRDRRLDERLVLADLAEQQETAVVQPHDPRQRRINKPFPGGLARSRLEAELLGATQHLGNADCSRAESMTDLLGIGAETVKTQQHDQSREARINY